MIDKFSYVNWFPLSGYQMTNYIRKQVAPPLRAEALTANLYFDYEKSILKTPTAGDFTIALCYRNREGFLISAETASDDLSVVQLQGAKSKVSYRINTGFNCLGFAYNELLKIAQHTDSPFRRLTMPDPIQIPGIVDSGKNMETVLQRYQGFIALAMLQFSGEEKKYIRDIK